MPGTKFTIQKLFNIFFQKGEVAEIRALNIDGRGPWAGYSKGTVSGYYNDPVKFETAAKKLDDLKRATGIYFTLNPVEPALLARANNRLVVPKNTTSDEQAICHRWLLIDTDPKRPSGISATDSELEKAIICRDEIAEYLYTNDWPEPIKAYSGNGGHLLYRLPDLPNSPEIAEFKKQALKALKYKFGNNDVQVDQTVSNASRICKLYGTLARKGDSTTDRPHRRSYLEQIPEPTIPVTLEQLRWLAGLAPKEKTDSYTPKPQAGATSVGKEKYARKVLESCCEKIRQSQPGDQHRIRLETAKLIGGYIQYIEKSEVVAELEQAIRNSGAQDMRKAMKDVHDGLKHGKSNPITIPDISPTQSHGESAQNEAAEQAIIPSLLPVPVDAFPDDIQLIIRALAEAHGTRYEVATIAILAIAGSLIGWSRQLIAKEGWHVHASQYAAISAETGEGKSPTTAFLVRPVEKLEQTEFLKHKAAVDEYLAELEKWQTAPKDTRGSGHEKWKM